MRAHVLIPCLWVGLAGAAAAQALDPSCGSLNNNVGPFDYRVEAGANRKIVEDYHFTPPVENLVSGQSASIGADIDYTLRAFPNHHRALVSMMNLGQRMKSMRPTGAQFSIDCYFLRALTFRPDDVVARMLFAKHLSVTQRREEALRQVIITVNNGGDNAFTHHNAGLLFYEMGDFQRALAQAHRAEALGFVNSRLRQLLESTGRWSPPVDAAAAAPAAPAVPSTSADTAAPPAPAGSQPGR